MLFEREVGIFAMSSGLIYLILFEDRSFSRWFHDDL